MNKIGNTRIPVMQQPITKATVSEWFNNMQRAGLLFHPEDDPAFVLTRASAYTGKCDFLFTPIEVTVLKTIMESIEEAGITDPCALALEATT